MLINTINLQRVRDWKGFLEVIRRFLPYCFNHNRHNHARNLSYFYCHMRKLEKDNEETYIFMLKGDFMGSLTGKPDSRIRMGQIIETTVNRWSKEVGRICGKTDNDCATERWIRINHVLSVLKEHQQKNLIKKKIPHHEDLSKKKMIRDKKNVKCVLMWVKGFVPELWSDDQPLVHLTSGEIASKSMVIEFKTAKKRGEDSRKEFFSRFTRVNLLVTTKSTYYDSISKQPCTFSAPKKPANKGLVMPTDDTLLLRKLMMYVCMRLSSIPLTYLTMTILIFLAVS